MSEPMKQYCTKIVWRCAVVFIICTCLITCVHNRIVAASENEVPQITCEDTAPEGTVEKHTAKENALEGSGLVFITDLPQEVAETPDTKWPESRYDELTIEEIDLLAKIIWLEARGESAEGQQAVAEVVLNRVASSQFPDTLKEVVYQKGQFSTASRISDAEPDATQYQVIFTAMYGENILPMDVVFFATTPENDNLWGWIGNHAFCYAYRWED